MTKLIDQQSQELDPKKRAALVAQIQRQLEDDAARPVMGWRTDRFAMQPYVKNLAPHPFGYNCCCHDRGGRQARDPAGEARNLFDVPTAEIQFESAPFSENARTDPEQGESGGTYRHPLQMALGNGAQWTPLRA